MIVRVFPRKTNATPLDERVRFGPPGLFDDDVSEALISVAFTYDLPKAEKLYRAWKERAIVKIGGPATGQAEGIFTPGVFLKRGYVVTSRGCPNRCWFCNVWKRNGDIKELPITEGWDVLDDNLLACSDTHVQNVFNMLLRQPNSPRFTGGLDARLLKNWHIKELKKLKPAVVFFAYDAPDDYDALLDIHLMIKGVNNLRSYVLIGYKGDTLEKANKRCEEVFRLGFMPMAMLYVNDEGNYDHTFKKLQREWTRPIIIGAKRRMLK